MSTKTVSRRNNSILRPNIYINKSFQNRFIAWFIALIILFGLCSAILLYWLISSDLVIQSQSTNAYIGDTGQHLGVSILIGNVIAAIIAGLISVVVVLYISHKIAGPMYRLESLFSQVGNGDFDVSTQLRKNDQLQELVQSFQAMVDKLSKRRQQQKAMVTETLEIIDSMDAKNDDDTLFSLRNKIKDLENSL